MRTTSAPATDLRQRTGDGLGNSPGPRDATASARASATFGGFGYASAPATASHNGNATSTTAAMAMASRGGNVSDYATAVINAPRRDALGYGKVRRHRTDIGKGAVTAATTAAQTPTSAQSRRLRQRAGYGAGYGHDNGFFAREKDGLQVKGSAENRSWGFLARDFLSKTGKLAIWTIETAEEA